MRIHILLFTLATMLFNLEVVANERTFPQSAERTVADSSRVFNDNREDKLSVRQFGKSRLEVSELSERSFHSSLLGTSHLEDTSSNDRSSQSELAATLSEHNPSIEPLSSQTESYTERFLSDPARVGGLVGGITAGAVFLNPLAPIVGNVIGYFVGKSSHFSEREKLQTKQVQSHRPIAGTSGSIEKIRLPNRN